MAEASPQALTDSLKAALADIQQPPLPDEFYLAPGYLLLALPLLLLLGWWLYKCWQRHQRNQPRRLALKRLSELSLTDEAAANQILLLLKQYLKTRNPRHPALTMNSRQLTGFLSEQVNLNASWPDLDALLYSKTPADADVALFARLATQWLQQHPEQVLYV